ncbi:hypothetical protein [Chryseobacterium vrystaatense]|uniref:YD repeat-containing protein n=1 Tax=Chryseobacterium vrystaatense TaxID=307480 RepID=A0ABR4UFA4_9FLAO|nr:hypothetical protein [Chryseobacterium vrystaatense]KFF23168.1 hypothetical protein IW16_26375 [Chryseobacterium vrystaatense]
MKKTILALFLTVGISGIALANNSVPNVSEHKMETKVVTKEKGDKKQVTTYNYVNGVLFSCTIATHTRQYDTCGNYVGTVKESYEAYGSGCSEAGEGGLLIKVTRMMTGFGDCPANY